MGTEKNYVFEDIYASYVKGGGERDYKTFREVCIRFNLRAMDHMIYHGRTLHMGFNLSSLSVCKSEVNYAKQRIDWGESNKLKQEILSEGNTLYSKENPEGHKWLVYYTNDYFIHFLWRKSKCRVPNKVVYRFNPTRGKKGNKEKLIALLRSNPLAHTRYDLRVTNHGSI